MNTNEPAKQEIASFQLEWPLERLRNITLEEYTNSDRDSSFIYWLEKKTMNAGSIYGGSAFKFGIYKRRNIEVFYEKNMVKTDGVYAWLSKYGSTKEEAFERVKAMVISIANASAKAQFVEIDEIELGDVVKWKIAFLYNPEKLVPILNPKVLFRAAQGTGLEDTKNNEISVLQKHLLEKKPNSLDTAQFATQLWAKFNLDNFYSTVEKFLEEAKTDNLKRRGYPSSYKNLDVKVSFGAGNVSRIPWIAFLNEFNTVSDGIYPVYLYYKLENLLILAYGVSETNNPTYKWPNESKLRTIRDWFIDNKSIKPDRYGASFIHSVYDLEEELDPEQLQLDLEDIIELYTTINFGNPQVVEEPTSEYQTKKIWLIAPGEGAYQWEEFYNSGIIGIEWDKIGDLSRFSSREEIRNQLIDLYPEGSKGQTNNSLALWEFYREMKVGDILIAKKGTTQYLGYGIVQSSYRFDDRRENYKHVRTVEWKKKGVWEEKVHQIVLKTLTDITKYPEHVDRLKRLIGIEQPATVDVNKIEYYWLNANPKLWKIGDFQVGQEQSYKTHNDKGNKRSRYENFQDIKPGDLVVGYETLPIRKVVAIFEITQGIHLDEDTGNEEISFKIQKFLPSPVSYEIIRTMPELSKSEIVKSNQGSLLKMTENEFNAIIEKDIAVELNHQPYTKEDAKREIFVESEILDNILNALDYKKNIILQGPPGVGKTFLAKRLAYLVMEEKDISKIETIQFHQSYSYEDFIQGYRPKENGTFKLENGIFYRFCKRATADPSNKYFFIIDEINRGNLSKIFGELMLLIESDKRGEENAISLTYSVANENKFYIPENVYLIGTMNTADRSLSIVDYALRRRFSFIDLQPAFNQNFKNELINRGVDEGVLSMLIEKINSLNLEIGKDGNLGKAFRIGHSYFCNIPKDSGDVDWYHYIVRNEIAPLLNEYWFDNEEKSSLEIKRLQIK